MRIRHEPFAQFEGRFDMGGLCSATAPNLGTVRARGAIYVAEIVKGIQEADGEVHAPLLTDAGPEEDSEELVIGEASGSCFEASHRATLFRARVVLSVPLAII